MRFLFSFINVIIPGCTIILNDKPIKSSKADNNIIIVVIIRM